ncbi:pathogenesis-related thaumatin-like protein 3.5 [Salvia miltiorrhiza]|uniref:pathogenesis-related thaumatin-like protein 3.5 n=1 Tax=Salvia miltiorrhiza TaxID=226208 RepID=UPI0025AB70A5|nr:pathogenesis-related thaumatin-like protein 3.5 [Salvia miltiorrhiza]
MALVINHLGTFLLIVFVFVASSGVRVSECTKFTIINNCNETIWPGIHPSNFSTGGFGLRPNQSAVFSPPPAWHGRIWARTACDFTHNGTCQTGGCGPSLQCTEPGQPPASIAEFALGGDIDYYDVSLVDGFNLPLLIVPLSGKGNCSSAGCDVDLRPDCPPELAMRSGGKVVACRSACNAFDTDEYCCRAAFSTPMACLPTNYSRRFKVACPAAYSFAYDDPTSIVTCSAADYMLAFCSSKNQTASQCTYHDNKLICNAASGMLKMKQLWRVMAVLVAIVSPVLM